MNDTEYMHHVGKEISPEQFIAEHTLLYVIKGVMHVYDGNKKLTLNAGDCCLGRKNRLARYNKEKMNGEIEKVFVFFDEGFLRKFQERYNPMVAKLTSDESLIEIKKNKLLPGFIQSLLPYYHRLIIKEPFNHVKREELLLILLQDQPELTGLLFDYGIPEKINIEEFMNRNFKFNVSIARFAYLTGRSLSAFKRDFNRVFGDTPNRWLVKKRLKEAHFLIEKKKKKPSEIYLDLGFETLQHFSIAFKKKFNYTPSELASR
ncbi:AraC family transcriptional regulator [Mucilaginibacter sp. SMC90]|uniref:AraC family transcriptional regulator n=1 Tax=Mucilaginibacter sp. SMC90 TaxID=2929803 RepID=UPI001FB2034E|nr:AraC family transcriptional regulator [Mucilaginibacter sp. SMC90]UOE51371.1 AraC family transcriptional regulator [Mucilaginibacter sp. SMC90]